MNFWKALFKCLGTQLNFNIAYHLQTDGKSERVNHVLEDILRMYLMEKPRKWEEFLQLLYNFQVSAGMSPFEILCGLKCNTHANFIEQSSC